MKAAKENTLQRILETGSQLITQKGFNNVGLNEILETVNVPKGSFYYYFKSKEAFGLEVIRYYGDQSFALMQSFLEDKDKPAKQRFMDFFNEIRSMYIAKDYTEGCLLGNCSLELGDIKSSYATAVAVELDRWEVLFADCIREGQEDGSIGTASDAKELAAFMLNNWEGAILRMKSQKSAEALSVFIAFTEQLLD
ncbi:MAG: TetR family transcriptional regulator C-terminal domain-containing protein [Flavobacteriaceae bacterium]|nr:TetR family transcriptional regulator C-terminal domain-containing protein [Flavobacteriaceae bacterium]